MAKKNTAGIYLLAFLITIGLFSVTGAIIWNGLRSSKSNTMSLYSTNEPLTNHSLDQVQLKSEHNVDYSKLREYLQQKDWRDADRETYLRMLDAAGAEALAKGMTPQDEMDTFSCTDLKTIDQLWSVGSNGQQGFTVQMNIFRALGNDYRQMYDKVKWQKLPPSNQWLFQLTYNTQTRRMEFLPGKEPNYKDPPPGHLPTAEIGYNFDVALSSALKRCGF